MSANAPAADAAPAPTPGRRRRWLAMVAGVIVLLALGYAAYWYVVLRGTQSTDDAYVTGHVVQLTPQIAGQVVAIHGEETDFVKAGQTLVELDPADARVALAQAEAQLGQAVRLARTLYVNNASFEATVRLRQADAARAASDVERAQSDLDRRAKLKGSGAVSAEEINHATAAVAAARSAQAAAVAAVHAAQEQLQSNRALTEGVPPEQHPSVQAAAARVREAWLALHRTTIVAPVDGYVARRSVQVGARVAPGAALMAIVPLGEVWVDANFKEVQLRDMRIGQPVRLRADMYGSTVEFDGRIAGLGIGTGAAFAVLPAQNATGNWIKVVQRVPVRVQLEPAQLQAHPLRVGLSMLVDVNTRDRSGPVLAASPRNEPVATTPGYGNETKEADAIVERIIAANLGRRPAAAAAVGSSVAPARMGQGTQASVAAR